MYLKNYFCCSLVTYFLVKQPIFAVNSRIVSDLTIDQIVELARAGKCLEHHHQALELKENWQPHFGKSLSALANLLEPRIRWLVVGILNDGSTKGYSSERSAELEHAISNQITSKLSPAWAVKSISAHEVTAEKYIVAIQVQSPNDVTTWDGVPYKRIGTSASEMSPSEQLELSMLLPGADYSKAKWNGQVDPSLVVDFAQAVQVARQNSGAIDSSKASSEEILSYYNIKDSVTSKILFGDTTARVSYFDERGEILNQIDKKGLFQILSHEFTEEIQSWTRARIATLDGAAAVSQSPYPEYAIREVLANAVAHANYTTPEEGDVVVELHPQKLTVSNICDLDAEVFAQKWLSRQHNAHNKHLMNTLRQPRITDDHGSGKYRVFRHMLDHGKSAPEVQFDRMKNKGRWWITLQNNSGNSNLKNLIDTRLIQYFTNDTELRVASALLLWRDKKWSEIKKYIDDSFQNVAEIVLQSSSSPVFLIGDDLIVRRWARIALEKGQFTTAFTIREKELYERFFREWAKRDNSDQIITSAKAKELIGMTNSKSENSQMARLFTEWKEKEIVTRVRSGVWRFI